MNKVIITIGLLITNFCFGQYQQFEQLITSYLSGPVQSDFFRFQTPNNIQAGQLYSWYKNTTPEFDFNDQQVVKHLIIKR